MTFSLLLLLIKATVILVAALGITIAMQRTSATARHLVWLVTLGGLLLVPALTAWSPLRLAVLPPSLDFKMSVADSHLGQGAPSPRSAAQNDVTLTASNGASLIASSTPAPSVDNGAPIQKSALTIPGLALSGPPLIVGIWGAVVLAILLSLAWAGMSVRRIVRNARPLDSPDWMTPLFEIADRPAVKNMAVRALAGGHAAGPWPWPNPRPFP